MNPIVPSVRFPRGGAAPDVAGSSSLPGGPVLADRRLADGAWPAAMPQEAPVADPHVAALDALRAGLLQRPNAVIEPCWLYDETGCRLFEAITACRDYYVTRTEQAIMDRHLPQIATAIQAVLGDISLVIEPGAGNCRKAQALCAALQPRRYLGLDVAADFMAAGAARLAAAQPGLQVYTRAADISRGLPVPVGLPRQGRLVFYPGTSLGNFESGAAVALLREMRRAAGERGGALLLGIDRVKDEPTLVRAYDDGERITARFNLNVLRHVNRALGADFDLDAWRHEAVWQSRLERVEMHLVARWPQWVLWDGGGRRFDAGDHIHTESSHKYTDATIRALLSLAGWHVHRSWQDDDQAFSVLLAVC